MRLDRAALPVEAGSADTAVESSVAAAILIVVACPVAFCARHADRVVTKAGTAPRRLRARLGRARFDANAHPIGADPSAAGIGFVDGKALPFEAALAFNARDICARITVDTFVVDACEALIAAATVALR
jgi:hypothetical protein